MTDEERELILKWIRNVKSAQRLVEYSLSWLKRKR